MIFINPDSDTPYDRNRLLQFHNHHSTKLSALWTKLYSYWHDRKNSRASCEVCFCGLQMHVIRLTLFSSLPLGNPICDLRVNWLQLHLSGKRKLHSKYTTTATLL